jgi:hypothetical protein
MDYRTVGAQAVVCEPRYFIARSLMFQDPFIAAGARHVEATIGRPGGLEWLGLVQ